MSSVIVATARTPIGRAFKGSLSDVRPDDLLGLVVDAVAEKTGIPRDGYDDFVVGSTIHGGASNILNVSRGAQVLGDIPMTVPAQVVNRQCGSSLQAIRIADHAIRVGEASAILVGGIDAVSWVRGGGDGSDEVHPAWREDGHGLPNIYITMGETAENVAEQFGVSREDMDRFAQQSQERAVAAQSAGVFDREIVQVTKADGTVVTKDDGPRASSTLEKLASLEPVFREGGSVTAGNACPLNDGAAAVVVMDEDRARAEGLTPLARIITSGVTGLMPEIMGVGPIEAIKKVLDQANMKIDDIDVMELNEAFASQVLAVTREVGLDPFSDRLNPHGGAIALGHPFGQTGARIMTTLLNDLHTLDREIGLETMCCGGGQGIAMIVERLN